MSDVDDLVAAMVKGDPLELVPLELITDMAETVLTAGGRAPLETEPNEKYPYGWSEDRATCRRRGHPMSGITVGGEPNAPCWKCRQRKRQANCDHQPKLRWAGILGDRYECAHCGLSLPNPNEPEDTDG